MKKLFYLFVTILFQVPGIISFAQLKEVDEKKEFIGLTFLSLPDYSTLAYFKQGPDFNLYELKTPRSFTTAEYSISKIYITIKKGRIMDSICVIDSDKDYENIVKELKNTFPTQVEVKNNTTFHGKNIVFLPQKNNTQKTLFIATGQTDTIPDIKDNSRLLDLIGKDVSDPAVKQFIAGLNGKCDKWKDRWVWPEDGIEMWLKSTKEHIVWGITFYLINMEPYTSMFKLKKPYTGAILPYQLSASSTALELVDKFGAPDDINSVGSFPDYKKFHISARFTPLNSIPIEDKKFISVTVY